MDEYNNQNVEVVYGEAAVEPLKPQKKGFAIASLVLGITSIIPGCCCSWIGVILGILAIVFAILFLNANKGALVSKGMAIAGLILGAVGILVCTILLIIGIANVASGGYQDMIDEITNGIEQGLDQ